MYPGLISGLFATRTTLSLLSFTVAAWRSRAERSLLWDFDQLVSETSQGDKSLGFGKNVWHAGKSSLAVQFVENQFVDSYDPTIENSKHRKLFSVSFNLQVVQMSGVVYTGVCLND